MKRPLLKLCPSKRTTLLTDILAQEKWLDASLIADGSVDNTKFQYLNGVTSAIQTQIDALLTRIRRLELANSYYSQIGQDIDGEANDDNSGWSVSINSDGTIVAIGAIYNDGNGSNSGHVRVYQYNGSQWVQIGQDIDGEDTRDYSGWSVSLNSDGTIVAIGARDNDGNGTNSGHVRVYQLTTP